MHPSAAHVAFPHSKPAHVWGVVVGVCALHGLLIWFVHGALRQEAQAPKPVVVAARLILPPTMAASPSTNTSRVVSATSNSASNPKPHKVPPVVAPLPAPAQVAIAPLAQPQATVPVLSAPHSAAPAASAPLAAPGPFAPATSPAPASAQGSATGPVRVAAALQASGTCAKPAYPELSRRREEQGSVQLKFLVAVDGRVVESHVEQSSGYPRLDEAARVGLSKCQFKPGTVDGKPEASWASMKYIWRLE